MNRGGKRGKGKKGKRLKGHYDVGWAMATINFLSSGRRI
jgi:hypothetical protein